MQQQVTEDEALAIVAGLDLPSAVQRAVDHQTVTAPQRMHGAADADNDEEDVNGAGVASHVFDRAAQSMIHVARSFATNDMY